MGCAVIFSAQSNRDLAAIVAFVAANSPEAAARLGNSLVDRALMLGAHPHLGAPVRDRQGVRRLAHRPWIVIYYRVDPERQTVEIARFWDARQNPDTLRA
jgi:plasmid stabilization system protein ParE